jgi:hypothetical protein
LESLPALLDRAGAPRIGRLIVRLSGRHVKTGKGVSDVAVTAEPKTTRMQLADDRKKVYSSYSGLNNASDADAMMMFAEAVSGLQEVNPDHIFRIREEILANN